MSTISGGTGRGFSRLDWALLVVALVVLGPVLFDALNEWGLLFRELLWSP